MFMLEIIKTVLKEANSQVYALLHYTILMFYVLTHTHMHTNLVDKSTSREQPRLVHAWIIKK